jgi:hypothetical protein
MTSNGYLESDCQYYSAGGNPHRICHKEAECTNHVQKDIPPALYIRHVNSSTNLRQPLRSQYVKLARSACGAQQCFEGTHTPEPHRVAVPSVRLGHTAEQKPTGMHLVDVMVGCRPWL